jgi:S1-C subfamily serine protease
MPPPTGRLSTKKGRPFHQIVADMRHVVCSVVRRRPAPASAGPNATMAAALGTGFFASRDVFLTCDHVMNNPADPHLPGDSYWLVGNLTGTSGHVYTIDNPQIGQDIHLFPNLDLAVLRVPSTPNTQPYVAVDYGAVHEGQEIGVVGYPIPELTVISGNIAFNAVIYRAARGHVTARYVTNDGPLQQVPYIEVNFLFVPGNSGGPVFSPETGRVLGFVRGFRAVKVKESVATVSMIQQLPLGVSNQYIENLNAIYSVAVKLEFIRTTIESFGVSL